MRALTAVLLTLSMISIVDADLLRPCACGSEDAPACGSCPASRVKARTAQGSPTCKHCCGCDKQKKDGQPGEKPDGCTICPGPREPREAQADVVSIEAPAVAFLDQPQAAIVRLESRCVLGERPPAMPPDGPWRCSPEGLGVFLT